MSVQNLQALSLKKGKEKEKYRERANVGQEMKTKKCVHNVIKKEI